MSEQMNEKSNALNWFEISVTNIKRAINFYENVFNITMHEVNLSGIQMAIFPSTGEGGKVGGALVKSNMHQPSKKGSVVYLNANPDLQTIIQRMEKIGTNIILQKTQISPETGFMAFFEDSEGNLVGLHSTK